MTDALKPFAPGVLQTLSHNRENRLALLRAVRDTGSISAAARAVGMSYKGAWLALEAMNNLSAEPLFHRVSGGSGGGGTRLTPQGEALLAAGETVSTVTATLREALRHSVNDLGLLVRLGMKTSARNQFLGQVSAIEEGAINDTLRLTLRSGASIAATLTRTSREELGLQPGREALALVKASWVSLSAHCQGTQDNCLHGAVSHITAGEAQSEILVSLPGELSVCAVVDNPLLARLQLLPDAPVCASFAASSVIVAALP